MNSKTPRNGKNVTRKVITVAPQSQQVSAPKSSRYTYRQMECSSRRLSQVPDRSKNNRAIEVEVKEPFCTAFFRDNPEMLDIRPPAEKLADLYGKNNDVNLNLTLKEKIQLLTQIKTLENMVHGEDSVEVMRIHIQMGSLYNRSKKPKPALNHLKNAKKIGSKCEISKLEKEMLDIELSNSYLMLSKENPKNSKNTKNAEALLQNYLNEKDEDEANSSENRNPENENKEIKISEEMLDLRKKYAKARFFAQQNKFLDSNTYYEKVVTILSSIPGNVELADSAQEWADTRASLRDFNGASDLLYDAQYIYTQNGCEDDAEECEEKALKFEKMAQYQSLQQSQNNDQYQEGEEEELDQNSNENQYQSENENENDDNENQQSAMASSSASPNSRSSIKERENEISIHEINQNSIQPEINNNETNNDKDIETNNDKDNKKEKNDNEIEQNMIQNDSQEKNINNENQLTDIIQDSFTKLENNPNLENQTEQKNELEKSSSSHSTSRKTENETQDKEFVDEKKPVIEFNSIEKTIQPPDNENQNEMNANKEIKLLENDEKSQNVSSEKVTQNEVETDFIIKSRDEPKLDSDLERILASSESSEKINSEDMDAMIEQEEKKQEEAEAEAKKEFDQENISDNEFESEKSDTSSQKSNSQNRSSRSFSDDEDKKSGQSSSFSKKSESDSNDFEDD